MPIKPENRKRYPLNWRAISADVRLQAQHRCQWDGCGARNYSYGHWCLDGRGLWVWKPLNTDEGTPASHAEARARAAEAAASLYGDDPEAPRLTIIVLTVAHLDHQPENVQPANLRAWCQRHHLAYDAQHHAQTAYASRRARMGTRDLFDDQP